MPQPEDPKPLDLIILDGKVAPISGDIARLVIRYGIMDLRDRLHNAIHPSDDPFYELGGDNPDYSEYVYQLHLGQFQSLMNLFDGR